MKALGIYTDWRGRKGKPGGCGFYRIVTPFRALQEKGFPVNYAGEITKHRLFRKPESAGELWGRIFGKYDIVWVNHIDTPIGIAQIFAARDYFKKKVVIDIDDDYIHVDKSSPVRRIYYPNSPATQYTLRAIEWADAVTVTTEKLKTLYSRWNKNVHVLPNYIEPRDWVTQKKRPFNSPLRIGYAGSWTHEGDLAVVIPSLMRILNTYNVRFVLFGYGSEVVKLLPANKIEVHAKPTRTFAEWPKRLSKLNLDIGICPLANTLFNKGKSYIKYLEYSMNRIPVIATGWASLPYSNIISHKTNGWLANTSEDWEEGLTTLIKDETLRMELGNNGYNTARAFYNINTHCGEWMKVMEGLYDS